MTDEFTEATAAATLHGIRLQIESDRRARASRLAFEEEEARRRLHYAEWMEEREAEE